MNQEELKPLSQEDKSSHDENHSRDVQQDKSLLPANEFKDDQQDYKYLLIANESKDADVTLYIYLGWAPFCNVSNISKIIKPNQKYLHREQTTFKFELVARIGEERTTKKILGPVKWVEDKLIKVAVSVESLDCTETCLAHFPEEKRVCLRKIYREKELRSTCGTLNLYETLGLDMEEVRKMDQKGQEAAIKKGYHEQMRIWHPDKNYGDHEIATQIIIAKEVLLDKERRACYNNEADYDKGWLSLKRYKAIFWPECLTEDQNKAYWRRIGLLVVSLVGLVGGIALSACTAGAAAPVVVWCGAIFGGGLTGAGIQSLMYTLNKSSVVDGCDASAWLKKAAIGFVGGALTGGAAAGITQGVVGIGSQALESSAVTFGQYVGIGAATGAVGGVASSLASDAARVLVDGEKFVADKVALHAVCGALVGAGAGALGGLATKGIVSHQASAATTNLEGEVAEQVAIMTGAKRLANNLARVVSRQVTESGTEAVMGTATQFAEERLDNSVENQHPMKHVVRGVTNVAANVGLGCAMQVSGALVSHATNEVKIRRKVKNEQVIRGMARYDSVKNNEHRINWQSGKGSASYDPMETNKPSKIIHQDHHTNDATCQEPEEEGQSKTTHQPNAISEEPEASESLKITHQPNIVISEEPEASESSKTTHQSNDVISEEGDADESYEGAIKYISEGYWVSKMIVTYSLNDEKSKQEVSGSGKIVRLPSGATQIEVRFQVWRPVWYDIKKYDRFKETWSQPYEAHVFLYEKPLYRTFTISGNLWWEAIMRVSDEYHEETFE